MKRHKMRMPKKSAPKQENKGTTVKCSCCGYKTTKSAWERAVPPFCQMCGNVCYVKVGV